MIRSISLVILSLCLAACSTLAEKDRPEDTSVVRASYTRASGLVSAVSGGTTVCQVTVLEDADIVDRTLPKYGVTLNENGCSVTPVTAP